MCGLLATLAALLKVRFIVGVITPEGVFGGRPASKKVENGISYVDIGSVQLIFIEIAEINAGKFIDTELRTVFYFSSNIYHIEDCRCLVEVAHWADV